MPLARSTYLPLFLCTALIILIYFMNFDDRPDSKSPRSEVVVPKRSKVEYFEKWHGNAVAKFSKIKDYKEFWNSFARITNELDISSNIKQMGIISLQNTDEMKYAILPKKISPNPSVLITLGVGNDIASEKLLKQRMEKEGRNITFYGADPIVVPNEKLYQQIGTFFPFAVGGDAGFGTASVLENGGYANKNVAYIDILYFVDKVLKTKIIDFLWLDAEYAEYNMFDIFYRNGRFDQKNISFCQMSLEVHNPSEPQKQQFMVFINQLIADKRFGFFYNANVGHMRMWLFNFESDYCIEKFLVV